MLCLDSTIFHEVAQSQNITGKKKRRYYEMKSSLLLIKKIGNSKDKFFGYQYYILRSFYYLISSIFIKKNFSQFCISISAIRDFMIGKLGIYDFTKINSEVKKNILFKYKRKFKYN